MAIRTIEEIKQDISEAGNELCKIQQQSDIYIYLSDEDAATYKNIQEEITSLRTEINDDILFIKKTYRQLLKIREDAETLIRETNDHGALEISEKVHKAFLMLVEYNRILVAKIEEHKKLINERKRLLQKSEKYMSWFKNGQLISETRDELYEELQEAESDRYAAKKIKTRLMQKIQEYQNQVCLVEEQIQAIEEHLFPYAPACECGAKMIIKRSKRPGGEPYWGCPNNHSWQSVSNHNIDEAKQLVELYSARDKIKLPDITLKEDERESLQHETIAFDEYPSVIETEYSNYLFQSLAIPTGISIKEHFDKLLQYSRFRVFTKYKQSDSVDKNKRTIYSLALRLMNRGVVLRTDERTESKIKRCFMNEYYQSNDSNSTESRTEISLINNYIVYRSPHNEYSGVKKRKFAEVHFPKVLGKSWASYVYTQMPIRLLLREKENKTSAQNQCIDFLVCVGNKNIIIDFDDKIDTNSANILKRKGYIIEHFSSNDVNLYSQDTTQRLKNIIIPSSSSERLPYSKKYLIACKVVHQVAIAIVKMLEEGHISSICNLHLKISSKLFTDDEQELLLLFAVEEITELIENFAKLYGVEIKLNFFDENAEARWIQIGNGDDNPKSIVIRDIVLPINYLCSIHPFELIMPKKDSINEELLEYFLQYVYGFSQFKQGQFLAIQRTLCKKESIVLLPTGSGKSVIFQLCSMLLPGITVVISPLRALIEDQVSNLANKGINNVASIFSGDKDSKTNMLEKARAIMKNHSAMMLYIAPERMQMPTFREDIKALIEDNNFCLIAIDEAHCVSETGHDFRAAYLHIGRACRRLFKKEDKNFIPPIIALTGTASDNVLKDVKRDLEITNEDAIILPESFDRPELHFSIISCQSTEKYEYIRELIDQDIPQRLASSPSKRKLDKTPSGIIFTVLAAPKTKCDFDAWSLFNRLYKDKKDLHIGTYFSTIPHEFENPDGKEEIWDYIIKSYARDFKDNQCQLLVATKAFGMGIDKPNIRYIIHNSLSSSIEQYYQEVGRAGRDGEYSECVLLFSNHHEAWNEAVLNPNLDWNEFQQELYAQPDDRDDISSLLFFHQKNFVGPLDEINMMYAVLDCLRKPTNNCECFIEDSKFNINAKYIYQFYHSRNNKHMINEYLMPYLDNRIDLDRRKEEDMKNKIAKAIIRLVTLGIIKDYEYDYSKQEYTVYLGSITPESVLAKYKLFVNGCSHGRVNDEETHLKQISTKEGNLYYSFNVIKRYVQLIYETIEKGRRRALHSMFRLAAEAHKKSDRNEQDKFIRSEIQNYLVKDDTVDLVKSSDQYAGIHEILNSYPLYPNDVILDIIERERAKKTAGYAARTLESYPDHVGLLYLRAITLIKSQDFNNNDVVADIIHAYTSSEKYLIPRDESIKFLVKVMNLAFNSSGELFELIWSEMDVQSIRLIVKKVKELNKEDINEHFKEYLLLNIATQILHKMIGGKK